MRQDCGQGGAARRVRLQQLPQQLPRLQRHLTWHGMIVARKRQRRQLTPTRRRALSAMLPKDSVPSGVHRQAGAGMLHGSRACTAGASLTAGKV